jgi:hypothetical protein
MVPEGIMADKKCPDCNGDLTKIILFGRGWENPISGIAIDTKLGYYTEDEAGRSGTTGMFKPKGKVESYICNDCGRILMFGKAE